MHEVPYSDEAVVSFDQKWEDFRTGVSEIITLTEAEISSKATRMVGELGIPMDVKRVWGNFEPNSAHVKVAIVGTIFGLDVHVATEGEVEIVEEDSRHVLRYHIIDYSLPEQLKSIVEENIGERLDVAEIERCTRHEYEIPEGWDVELTDISVELIDEEYHLVIQGKVIE